MDEQMIADIAKAIGWATGDRNAYAAACAAARVAHSVIAGKVAELTAALDLARNRLRAAAVNEAPKQSREYYDYSQWADEADAALAPYPERRSE